MNEGREERAGEGRRRKRVRLGVAGGVAVLVLVGVGSLFMVQGLPGGAGAEGDDEPPIPVSPETAEWADGLFGVLPPDAAPTTFEGTGSTELAFPTGLDEADDPATALLVTVTRSGSGEFRLVQTIPGSTGPTTELGIPGALRDGVNRERRLIEPRGGAWSASGLAVRGEGDWTITLEPVSAAGALAGPTTGRGRDVLIHEGGAEELEFEHTGDGDYSVFTGAFSGGGASEAGWLDSLELAASGSGAGTASIPVPDGPVLVVISGAEWRLA